MDLSRSTINGIRDPDLQGRRPRQDRRATWASRASRTASRSRCPTSLGRRLLRRRGRAAERQRRVRQEHVRRLRRTRSRWRRCCCSRRPNPLERPARRVGNGAAVAADEQHPHRAHRRPAVDYDWTTLNLVGDHGGNIFTTTLPKPAPSTFDPATAPSISVGNDTITLLRRARPRRRPGVRYTTGGTPVGGLVDGGGYFVRLAGDLAHRLYLDLRGRARRHATRWSSRRRHRRPPRCASAVMADVSSRRRSSGHPARHLPDRRATPTSARGCG